MTGVRVRALGCTAAALALLASLPAVAGAETRQFVNTDQQYPTGGALNVGPSARYPSTISVDGLDGTVTKVRVTVFLSSSANADDIDMAIVGPNGQQVMLMSDSCGAAPLNDVTLIFDDAAQTFVPDGASCPDFQTSSYKPSNYEAPTDDFSVYGGPPPPYLNALSFLAGGSPNGAWKLFVLDDNGSAGAGFSIIGWALALDIEPPAAGDATAPDSQITAGPKKKSKKRRASFAFTSSEPGSTFECSLDGASFAACGSPLELKAGKGKHVFEVRAVDAAGNVDPTPAAQRWKVKK
jgi:hypothetical protein